MQLSRRPRQRCPFRRDAPPAADPLGILWLEVDDDAYNVFSGSFVQDSDSGGIIWFNLSTLSNRFIPGYDSTIAHAFECARSSDWLYCHVQHQWLLRFHDRSGLRARSHARYILGGPSSFALYAETSLSPPVTHQILSGTVTVGTIAPNLLSYLEDPNSGLTVFLPANSPASVPEPGSLALIGVGLGLIGGLRKRAKPA